jgi:DNA mismatch endonuclease (patch repair protein)
MYTICLQPMSNISSRPKTKDRLTKEARSELMARVKSKDTLVEKTIRRLVFNMGFRYRLHRKDLPGSPDLVFSSRRKVIFVHGCFWHGHNCKAGRNKPASNMPYWNSKLIMNKARDKKNLKQLSSLGWASLIIWECEIRKIDYLTKLIKRFLNNK